MRVLVADDSPVARSLMTSILSADAGLEVAGVAADGREATALARELAPDVIVMDVVMPVMDGFEATRRIMGEDPRPIVLVSAVHEPDSVAFRALEAGAVTILAKPAAPTSPEFPAEAAALVRTVKLMADVKLVRRTRSDTAAPAPRGRRPPPRRDRPATADIVVIAASTGGPQALARILRSLPAGYGLPVLIVQHIGVGFDSALADWLDSVSALSVRLARAGDRLRPGVVLIAPSDHHLEITENRRVALIDDPPLASHRPSATLTLRSLARVFGPRAMAVILTGMGRDGVQGLIDVRRAGGWTIAQDEASSVVYGMPRAAVEDQAALEVLSITEIASVLAGLRSGRASRG